MTTPSMSEAAKIRDVAAPSNVFVVGTGRCGTTTFAMACRHASNFTAAHESKAEQYPRNHIEVDPPLAFRIANLRSRYDCRIILLRRLDKAACVKSMASHDPLICAAFGNMVKHDPQCTAEKGADLLYDAINGLENLCDLTVDLETAKQQWGTVWEWIGCQGDLQRSLEEWNVKHNAS